VRVAVLDAHAFPHPDLVGRLEAEAEDTETYLRQTDKLPSHAGHATFVAGLIAQRAPLAGLDMHDVVDDDRPVTAWEIATAMARLAGSGVDVLTVSLGCHTADGAPPLLLERAVAALTPGVVVVAPAGNHGSAADGRVTPTTPFWPAALDAVVAVGAHDPGGTRAAFSPDVPWVNLSAPGVDVQSTYLFGNILVTDDNSDSTSLRPFDGYATWSSTTFATAAVCGEIAAGTVPGERAPREALNDLLRQLPSEAGVDIWAYDQRAGQ
jgi:hypothetical protein